ncbi:histidinol-phosphatase [Phytoactinopolyspora mesophila]|uniref:Histidinol-phosphatase n=1 Tax=Phytoactinopolyspora mesophila TaxID=2650750 RepID=A0A7K3M9Q2_9ACTN|nr:histidinol-phosphatase [Phytoactinopolyspora mesophila]
MAHDDDLRFAHVLADDADAQTLGRFRAADLKVDTKADHTPVSDADRATEEAIRRTLSRARPRDGIVGEEFGNEGYGARRWVIDPIDGTKNYVRGVPVWATLIGLMVEDEVVAGVVSAPALNRRWWAAKGTGAWTGRSLSSASRCRVSDVDKLGNASLSYSDLAEWEEHGRLDEFLDLTRACWRTRAYGDFWSYMLLADGAVDIAAEPELELYDMAALVPIVQEAGGRFTGLDGVPGPHSGDALATNGPLHDEVLARLQVH